MGVSAAVQLAVLAIPLVLRASQLEAKYENLARTGSEAHATHVREAQASDGIRDARLSALEKAAELRGAQLDRIEGDVKELLRLAK
jgi:hypothetical protein